MVDRVLDYEKGKSIRAIKNVTINEPFFQGHFPQKPVMPGVLIIEAMAQLTALMGYFSLEKEQSEDALYYLVGVDKTRFRKPVEPGDQLILEAKFITLRRNIWKFETSAKVGDDLVASAELLNTVMD